MFRLLYAPRFVRQLKRLPEDLQEEAITRIGLLKEVSHHTELKVHKLRGRLSGCFSFSVNFKTRIIFEYPSKGEIALLAIGDHEIYT